MSTMSVGDRVHRQEILEYLAFVSHEVRAYIESSLGLDCLDNTYTYPYTVRVCTRIRINDTVTFVRAQNNTT